MNYSTFRKEAQTGDLIFTASDTLVSRMIRFFTRSRVSHTAMLSWSTWGGEARLMVVEYTTEGFQTSFASEYIKKCREKKETVFFGKFPQLWKPKEYKIQKNIEKLSGGKYDYRGAIASLFREKKDYRFFCSEFVAEVLGLEKKASQKGFTPDDLAELCYLFHKIL